jgi:hypothetical protein
LYEFEYKIALHSFMMVGHCMSMSIRLYSKVL